MIFSHTSGMAPGMVILVGGLVHHFGPDWNKLKQKYLNNY